MSGSEQILIIEDDPDIADLVDINIRDLGYTLGKAADGESNAFSLYIGSAGLWMVGDAVI